MTRYHGRFLHAFAIGCVVVTTVAAEQTRAEPSANSLERRFVDVVQPFLKSHCFACHGASKQEAKLDLRGYTSLESVVKNHRVWERVLERLEAGEMPPEKATKQPAPHERRAIIEWIGALRDDVAQRNAGDPGPVVARRLSNAEFDYTIRDLTGVDIRPTREFPVDPANEAGFDNSGESLTMSPALVKKYLAAARYVADHVVLKPTGFVFAPHPAVTDTDRDKYCVRRIINFYERHKVDYADYFFAAWRFRHCDALGNPDASLREVAAEARLSAKYLATIWEILTETETAAGPSGEVQTLWRKLPAPATGETDGKQQNAAQTHDAVRRECEQMRDLVARLRKEYAPPAAKMHVQGISDGSQPFVLWGNRQLAAQHMRYQPAENAKGPADPVLDAALAPLLPGLSRYLFRVGSGSVFRSQGGRAGKAVDGRLPSDAGLFPRRWPALRVGSR